MSWFLNFVKGRSCLAGLLKKESMGKLITYTKGVNCWLMAAGLSFLAGGRGRQGKLIEIV